MSTATGDAKCVCVVGVRGEGKGEPSFARKLQCSQQPRVYFASVTENNPPLSFSLPSTCPTGYRPRQFTYVILPI